MTIRSITAALAATLLSTSAMAITGSASGTFMNDNDLGVVRFTVDKAGSVTLASTGYAAGGFEPVLSLYNATTGTIVEDASGTPTGYAQDGGAGIDPTLSLWLAAGNYSLYVSQYSNFGPIHLSTAFPFDGVWDFRNHFVDFYGSQRTGDWALTVSGAASSVPEAASFALFGLGAAGLLLRRRRAA